jgi:mono/diheme cytochrome c family protein
VFQGEAHGVLRAFAADDGKELWHYQTHRGIVAAPMTYRVKGVQYVAVMAGYGGSMGMATAAPFLRYPQPYGRLLVFRLDGKATTPAEPETAPAPLKPAKERYPAAAVADGEVHYFQYCSICHTGPVNPDLRRSDALADRETWRAVVIDGVLEANGMASFGAYLTPAQAENIRAYVSEQARLGGANPARNDR